MRRTTLRIFFICLVASTPYASAEVVAPFDPASGEFPESVAPDRFGNLYVSMTGDLGEIRQIDRKGEVSQFFKLQPAPLGSFGILGLATDHYGHVYAAIASFDPTTHGVWRIGSNGVGARIPGSQEILMPNDLDFDRHGNLYVTDTISGGIWRIGPATADGRSVELWAQDSLLQASGPLNPEVDLGANGIAIDDRDIYVAVTEGARVVSIKIQADGTAGPARVLAEHPDLFAIDGLDTDRRGRLYGAIIGLRGQGLGRIMRIRPKEAPEPILGPENGLQFPTNLAFSRQAKGQPELFVANWDVVAQDQGVEPMPAIHAFNLNPGPPRPVRPAPRPCFRIESLYGGH
jgi:sugar lactone lactonase YvrE